MTAHAWRRVRCAALGAALSLTAAHGLALAVSAQVRGAVARRASGSAANASPAPAEPWTRNRAYALPTLLVVVVLSMAVSFGAIRVLEPRLDNSLAVAVLLAIASASALTTLNGLLLFGEIWRTAPYEIVGFLSLGLVVMSPALLLIWLGATLCVVFRRGGLWGAFGALLVVAGVGLLIFIYNVINRGGSWYK